MSDVDHSYELTPQEEDLLRRHMEFYRALETGRRKPVTEAQKHFVNVTIGHAAAETVHEIAYVKHMRLRAVHREAADTQTSHDPADGPTEGWFSREDWYRLRGRQRSDMRSA